MAIDRAEFAPASAHSSQIVTPCSRSQRDVGLAAQEPQQLVDDGLDVELLRRHQRKAFVEIEPHLMAEDRERAGTGAVLLFHAGLQHFFHQVEILAHALFRVQIRGDNLKPIPGWRHEEFARSSQVPRFPGEDRRPAESDGQARRRAGQRPPSLLDPQRLYRACRGNSTMAINGCVISGPDPGAVPGASTRGQTERADSQGFLFRRGRNRIDGRVKAVLSLGMVSAVIGLFVQVPTIMKWPSLPNR